MKAILDISVLSLTLMMMLTVGMDLDGRDFRNLSASKGAVFCGLALQALILPALALLLTRFLRLPQHLSAGILLVGACPVGDIANYYALLARANIAFSVVFNVFSCLLSVLTMTTAVASYDFMLGRPFDLAAPRAELVLRLFLMTAVPLLAGMGLRRYLRVFVKQWSGRLRNLCLAGLAALLGYIMLSQRERLVIDWMQTAVAAALFMVLAMLAGLAFGRALRLAPREAATVAIVFPVRNVGLATAIAITLLHRIEYAVFATVYFLTEVPLLLAIVAVYRHRLGRRSTTPVNFQASA